MAIINYITNPGNCKVTIRYDDVAMTMIGIDAVNNYPVSVRFAITSPKQFDYTLGPNKSISVNIPQAKRPTWFWNTFITRNAETEVTVISGIEWECRLVV